MADKLCLLVCSNYLRDVEAALQAEGLDDVTVHAYPPACGDPAAAPGVWRLLEEQQRAGRQVCLLGACFAPAAEIARHLPPGCRLRRFDQCFSLLTTPALIDRYQADGAHLVSPGWLANWRARLEGWGFDQPTATTCFTESVTRIMLLDTGVDACSAARLAEFAAYVGLPCQTIPVGLDHLRLVLSTIVLTWRLDAEREAARLAAREVSQRAAGYATALDLLAGLPRSLTEAQVIDQILHLFTMLFGPSHLSYQAVDDGRSGRLAARPQPTPAADELRAWLASGDVAAWIGTADGFLLRFCAQGQTLGALAVEGTASPRHLQDYVNLALPIGQLCGLALANARLYERDQQARSARESESRRMQQVIELLPEAVLVYDADGSRLGINRAARRLLGEGLEGRAITEVEVIACHLDGSPYPLNELPVMRSLLYGSVVEGEQLLVRNLTTRVMCPVLLNSAPLLGADGSVLGAVSVFQDITAIKDLEREREQFWQVVTHDLKNPLAVVRGMGELLLRDTEQVEAPVRATLQRRLRKMLVASDRLLAQVNTVVVRARQPAAGHRTGPLDTVDLVPMLQALVHEYQQGTDRHTLLLRTTLRMAPVMANAESLRGAFANLLANAVKFSPDGGEIVVGIDQGMADGGTWVDVLIRDQGIGIPRADLPHVGEHYYRAGNAEGRIEGTGIGLASVRATVEELGGNLTIASAVGEGTTVTVRLPALAMTTASPV